MKWNEINPEAKKIKLGVPTFFILDEDRIVQKVISGYQKGKTDKLISGEIKKLM